MDTQTGNAMDMKILPWIQDDIAIEIIGKMIAEQTEQIYAVYAEYRQAGFDFNSNVAEQDSRYLEAMKRIGEFKSEIDRIYNGECVDELYEKVDREYVPHLQEQVVALHLDEAATHAK